MRVFILLSLSAVATALNKDMRRLTTEDVGLLHTDAFEQLAELWGDRKPKSQLDVMMDVSGIMEGYCDEADASCKNLAYESTLKAFNSGISSFSDVEYPENFHSGLKESMDKIGETLKDITDVNLDEVLSTLDEITNGMKDMVDVDELQQTVALSAASVAKESLQLWHSAHYGAEDHPYRRLQNSIADFLADIVNLTDAEILGPFEITWRIAGADATAALEAGLNIIDSVGTDTPEAVLVLPPTIMIAVLYFSIPASMNAALVLVVKAVTQFGP